MWQTMIRRFLIMIPQLIALSLLVVFLASLMPGDGLEGHYTDFMSQEEIDILREMWGLNDPWYIRYTRWVGNLLQGDFGRSQVHARPVWDIVGERLLNTFWLSLVSIFFVYLVSIPLGIVAGRWHDKLIDRAIVIYSFVTMAIPMIVFALIMLFFFGFRLRWFPVRGSVDPMVASGTFQYFLSRLHHLILPGITAGIMGGIGMVLLLRQRIIDFERSDFAMTARSKGVPTSKVYTRHVLKNAIIPIVGGFGFAIVGLFTGSIFYEMTFSYPGMGLLFIDSINRRDFPVLTILILFSGTLTVVGVFIGDLLLTIVDPRIRIR